MCVYVWSVGCVCVCVECRVCVYVWSVGCVRVSVKCRVCACMCEV